MRIRFASPLNTEAFGCGTNHFQLQQTVISEFDDNTYLM
jgi:hypothetical protein